MIATLVASAAVAIIAGIVLDRWLTPLDERRAVRCMMGAALPLSPILLLVTYPFQDVIYESNAGLGSYTSIFMSEVSVNLAIYLLVVNCAFVLPLWPLLTKLLPYPNRSKMLIRTAMAGAVGFQIGAMLSSILQVSMAPLPGGDAPDIESDWIMLATSAFSSIGTLIGSTGQLALVLWLCIRGKRWCIGIIAGYCLSLFGSSAIWLIPESVVPDFIPPIGMSLLVYFAHAVTIASVIVSVAIISWIAAQTDEDLHAPLGTAAPANPAANE